MQLTLTNTRPPVPSVGLPLKFLALIVVVFPKMGLVNEIWGKKGDEIRNWRVPGRGYIPAR